MSSFGIGLIIGACMVLIFQGWAKNSGPLDDTDNHATGQRSNMRVLIDHETGCQYLLSAGGGLTPRLDAAGRLICATKEGGQ